MGRKTLLHSKILTAAARKIFRPMGLIQKERSRTWIDDHIWWLCVVEFQPSSWSRGSYLNVGCNWLWHVKAHISFDEGHRVESFSEFRTEDQFQLAAENLVQKAALEVDRYRRLFSSVTAVSNYILFHRPVGFWPSFHAAVACAVAGQPDDAGIFFGNMTEPKGNDPGWMLAAHTDAAQLRAIAADTERFREVTADRILRTRELQKLASIESVDFGL